MNETRTVHDPFLERDVEVSVKLTDRLRGRYAVGPTGKDGKPELGWRTFPVPPVQEEAACRIEALEAALARFAALIDGKWGLPLAGDKQTVIARAERGMGHTQSQMIELRDVVRACHVLNRKTGD